MIWGWESVLGGSGVDVSMANTANFFFASCFQDLKCNLRVSCSGVEKLCSGVEISSEPTPEQLGYSSRVGSLTPE